MSAYVWYATDTSNWPAVWTFTVPHRGRWPWRCVLREPRGREPAVMEAS